MLSSAFRRDTSLHALSLLGVISLLPVAAAAKDSGWTYDLGTPSNCDGSVTGTGLCGPEYWANLDGAEKCAGDSQSPVNLAEAVFSKDIPQIEFDYKSSCSNWTDGATESKFNIQFAPLCYNLTIKILDEEYYLDSMHFHSPSEHTIGG